MLEATGTSLKFLMEVNITMANVNVMVCIHTSKAKYEEPQGTMIYQPVTPWNVSSCRRHQAFPAPGVVRQLRMRCAVPSRIPVAHTGWHTWKISKNQCNHVCKLIHVILWKHAHKWRSKWRGETIYRICYIHVCPPVYFTMCIYFTADLLVLRFVHLIFLLAFVIICYM